MRKYKKKEILYILVILLLGITLGYAYLNTELDINGTTNITSANWNIYWDNIQFGTNNVTDVTTPATIQTGKTEVIFNVNFQQPGDTYEFTVDAVNDGTIDAMISVVNSGVYASNGTTPKTLPEYLEYDVTYSDGVAISQNQLLEAGNTETYKVRVHYKEDITASQLPSTNDNYTFKFSVNYVQATNTAVTPSHPQYVYTVNKDGNPVYLNQAIPNNITQYQTAEEAMIAYEEHLTTFTKGMGKFYLKHRLENNVVTESYVEFIITPDMAQEYPGLVVGTYSLRGGVDERSSTEKPVYNANKEILKQAFGYTSNSDICYESYTGTESQSFVCEFYSDHYRLYNQIFLNEASVSLSADSHYWCSTSNSGAQCNWL